MNNVCLCIGRCATTPYYLKLADIYIYSIEELCYFFMDKTYLVDDTIVSIELVEWLRSECGLVELADELEVYARKHMSVASFVSTILEKTQMYDENTVKRIDRVLKEQSNLTPVEKYKKQAEYLYQQGRFRQALSMYVELLDYIPNRDTASRALLYYNMASIYAMDFAYSKAADFYYESYVLKPDSNSRQAYILASKLYLTDYAYGAFKRENPEWNDDFEIVERVYSQTMEKWQQSKEKQMLDEISGMKEKADWVGYSERADNLIKKLKSDYKRQTQN
jgi:tetratricopeptide (TPR) repeat protein